MKQIEDFWKEPKHITDEIYRELLKSPPKHYCASLMQKSKKDNLEEVQK